MTNSFCNTPKYNHDYKKKKNCYETLFEAYTGTFDFYFGLNSIKLNFLFTLFLNLLLNQLRKLSHGLFPIHAEMIGTIRQSSLHIQSIVVE